jgi:glucoamylase
MGEMKFAPGAPGLAPTWTSSAKSGIGKAINAGSHIVFTIGHGIVNEVYYPREDIVCVKEMGCIITDGKEFFSEEKKDTRSKIRMLKEGLPAYHLNNSHIEKKYVIEKEIIADPVRDALLQQIQLNVSQELDHPLQLFVVLYPHLHNRGSDNAGCIDDYKGVPMLFAYRKGLAIALACSVPWTKRSVGYVGTSDGRTDLLQHKNMHWEYEKAENGNIGLTAGIDLSSENKFVLALGFGTTMTEAGNRARASLLDGFETAKNRYVNDWEKWQRDVLEKRKQDKIIIENLKISASVLRMGEAKSFPGGIVASISIPWGNARGDDDLGGYHLVWPRDLAESAGGFLALNAEEDALRVLNYLMSIQEADGKWWQNVWLAGHPYWEGIQMDQVALPILLLDQCFRKKMIDHNRMKNYWPMIKKAISFLIINGPSTQQGRWEQQSGLGPYTLATEIAGLLAAANLAEVNDEKKVADYCRETADYWNSEVETWTYVIGSPLAKKVGVDGYYVWMNPFCVSIQHTSNEPISVDNVSKENSNTSVSDIVSVDALALVRFGLRDAKDQRILNTIKVIDATLKVDTPYGPCWHRFTNDVYGEDEKGNSFVSKSQKGKGRAWPLLTGERAHYEIAAGNIEGAKDLLRTMDAFSQNGFLPEQVWDAEDIPEKELYCGRPTGSAMPLTWAHAEYIKLCFSIEENKVIDMPQYVHERYVEQKNSFDHVSWRIQWPCKTIPAGKILRIELRSPATVHWSDDNWSTQNDTDTTDTTLGLHFVDIKPHHENVDKIKFTFFWKNSNTWENKDYIVQLKKMNGAINA